MHVLPAAGHRHHAELMPHLDAIPALADALDGPPAEVRARLAETQRFIVGQLMPHMEQAEATIYPQLERLMQNRHSMTPMRREHEELRRMIQELDALVDRDLTLATRLRLRRILFRLYSILKIHLGEEDAYIGVLDHNLSDEEQTALARALEHATVEAAAKA
jgi:hypothetical protein